MIHAAITRIVADEPTPSGLAELKRIQQRFRAMVKDNNVAEAVVCNHGFHEAIDAMSTNPRLTLAPGRLLIDHTRMSQTFHRPLDDSDRARVNEACEQNDAIIDAIECRDPARDVESTLAHRALSRDQIKRYVRPGSLPDDSLTYPGEGTTDAV